MGTWSTTAPANLKTGWTAMAANASTNGQYRIKIGGSYIVLTFACRVRACSAWLADGRLCVKIENYSYATGDTDKGNTLVTRASVTNESGTTVYAPNNTGSMGDSTETSYGHLRGTYYYTYDASYTSPGTITAGIKPVNPADVPSLYPEGTSTSYWVDASCTVTVSKAARPSYDGGGGDGGGDDGDDDNDGNAVYIKVNGAWKKAEAVYIKVNGVWKKAADTKIKTGGAWK